MIHCLHGAVGTHHHWDQFTDSFDEKIIQHDLWTLFQNQSPSLPEAGLLLNQVATKNDILLGYSMGGRLALHALLTSPTPWRAAIIISAHPGLTTSRSERLTKDEDWADLAERDWPAFLTQWNAQSILPTISQGFPQPSPEDQSAIAKSFRHWSLGAQENLRPRLPEITCPVLWITGENDRKFTTLAEKNHPLIPHATHQIIPDCGHRVPWEHPERFAETARKFLTEKP